MPADAEGDGRDDLFIGASWTDATGRDPGTVDGVTASDGGSLSGSLASADGPHAGRRILSTWRLTLAESAAWR